MAKPEMTETASESPSGTTLAGRSIRRVRGGGLGFLRIATGWALARAVLSGVFWLVGARTEAELTLDRNELRVRTVRRMLGRVVREREQVVARRAVVAVTRELQFPARYSLLTALVLGLCFLVAGGFIYAGATAGRAVVLLLGATILLGGVIVDFVSDVLLARGKPCVAVELNVTKKPVLRIAGVSREDADRFMEAFRRTE